MENKQMENAINEVRAKYLGKRDGYDMNCNECIELARISRNKPFESVTMSFDYGFMKGIRFAKAMMKKGERF